MTGIIKLNIVESVEELLEELKKSENIELKERIQTLYWLKTKQVESTGAIANLTGKHRTTISRWLSQYRREGLKGIEMSYTRVHHIVRYKLKAKLKVPRPVHIKQEPGAVEEFKKN